MAIFQTTYQRIIALAAHRLAPVYLWMLSMFEAIVVPIPPDAMLIPMVLARRNKAWLFALITSAASVVGGVIGYYIGVFLFESIGWPVVQIYSLEDEFKTLQAWYADHGAWIVLFAGFTPIPYKLFTIGSGAFAMAFVPFLLMSAIGRSLRFFVVSAICLWAGESINNFMQRYATPVGWGVVIAVLLGFVIWSL